MMTPYLPQLLESRIVLASASPRRSELLRGLGLLIEVIPSSFSENLEKTLYENAGEGKHSNVCNPFFLRVTGLGSKRSTGGYVPFVYHACI